MLFTPENVRRILADEKTQTRRVVRPDHIRYAHISPNAPPYYYVKRGDRILWQTGKTYAIQPGRGKAAVAHFLLEQIRYCARAADISEDDAHAEGFDSAADFCAYYARLNGADALDQPCWALSFHLVEDEKEQKHVASSINRPTLSLPLAAAKGQVSEVAQKNRLAVYARLMQDLHDAQQAVDDAGAALVAWESDGGEWPGNAPLDDAMERREAAIAAIVRTVAAWGNQKG